MLEAQFGVSDVIAMARNAQIYIAGIGEVDRESFIASAGMVDDEDVDAVVKTGAVAEILGQFFADDGSTSAEQSVRPGARAAYRRTQITPHCRFGGRLSQDSGHPRDPVERTSFRPDHRRGYGSAPRQPKTGTRARQEERKIRTGLSQDGCNHRSKRRNGTCTTRKRACLKLSSKTN